MADIYVGTRVRFSCSFYRLSDGALTNPTTIELKLWAAYNTSAADWASAPYSTLTGGSLTNDSVGHFYYELVMPASPTADVWSYEWVGTGAVSQKSRGNFVVTY